MEFIKFPGRVKPNKISDDILTLLYNKQCEFSQRIERARFKQQSNSFSIL